MKKLLFAIAFFFAFFAMCTDNAELEDTISLAMFALASFVFGYNYTKIKEFLTTNN